MRADTHVDAAWGNVTRADPDILRSSFSTKPANFYRLPAGPLDSPLAQQAATTDATKRKQLVDQTQQLIVRTAEKLFSRPRHAYTREMLATIPGGRYATAASEPLEAKEHA
ncbi:hypothetical protein AB0H86_08990 [Streptomyces sp. NPDC050997]|uniref:hypothetical protein n=1 Tax=Streptomyces sp. NPDC050997 TaxID=3155519 RepID=UPI003442A703